MTAPALRRELTAAERHVDIRGLVDALEQAKLDLAAEIQREQRRAARAVMAGRRANLVITPRMAAILARLYQRGVRAAIDESASMGVALRKALEAEPAPIPPGTIRPYLRLRVLLGELGRRLTGEGAARLAIQADSRPEMLRALIRVPGAMNAAGQVVSKTLFSGLGDVYGANEDLFSGWVHTAILDGGTCQECEDADGTEYPTWAAITEVLPDGGPYINCLGGDRCRCRALPIGPA